MADTVNPMGYVAQTIFGHNPGNCWGNTGGGNISNQGLSSFFYCQWCGKRIDDGVHLLPSTCPKFPFPEFEIVGLMRKLGERNVNVCIRYDSMRSENNFTLIGPQGRICDTDEPLRALCQWVMDELENLVTIV
jgi:hypothetical protein